MLTAYITHPSYALHDMGALHPESPLRLRAVDDRLYAANLFDFLQHREARAATREELLRVHDAAYVAAIEAASPNAGQYMLDPDTSMNTHTLDAAYHAAGGAAMAVDLVMRGDATNAFVACRPPGHHATHDHAMGFCIFNNVAVAAAHALAAHGLTRVAIIDFDVHHGNGTEDIFTHEPRVMFCSTFQYPFYPHCGADTTSDHIVNVPLPAGTTGSTYREAFEARVMPRLDAFRPQMLFCSAGFDGHREDEIAQFGLVEADYAWITEQVMHIAARHAEGRIVSVLEGGYDLSALGRSAATHIRTLAGL
ncbi:MAG TPA: histone deacetylase family protein [Thiobacillaceae bacterium]|nr:histone deacetylase family protein [Thiobacillaceae bacterium]